MKETKSSKSLPPPYSSPSLLPFGKNFNVGNPLTPYLDIQQWHSFLQGCNIENASFTDNQAYLLKFHLLLSQILVFVSIQISNDYIIFQCKCGCHLFICLEQQIGSQHRCSLAQKWQQTPIYKEKLLLLTGARFLQWPHLIEAQSRNQLTNNMITSKRKDHTNKNRNLTKGRCILTMVHKIQPKHLCFCPKLSHQNYQLLVPPHWMGLQLSSHWFL